MNKNIFIEGIPGSGKSTLLIKLSKALSEYNVYHEGDISPVELAWCSYMTEKKLQEAIAKFPDLESEILAKTKKEGDYYITAYTQIMAERREFYEYMESYEIYNGRVDFDTFHEIVMRRYRALSTRKNLFECSLFQNTIESMMLFYGMSDEEIIAFYSEVYEILKEKGIFVIYLETVDIRENISLIKKERSDDEGNEMWYPLMLGFLRESPYGKAHNYQDFEDMVDHFERRQNLERRIMEEVFGDDCMILPAKEYRLEEVLETIGAR